MQYKSILDLSNYIYVELKYYSKANHTDQKLDAI